MICLNNPEHEIAKIISDEIGRTRLLQVLYERIAISPAVAVELDQAEPLHADWRRQLKFVQVTETAADDPVMRRPVNEVDAGEAAAIALGLRHGSELLIIAVVG